MKSYKVYRYLANEFLISFGVAFLFFFFIFFVNQLLVLAEDVLSKNVPFLDVAKLIFYSFPAIIAFSFPFASLVGGLMAVGRLSGDNEILALQASGLPLYSLAVPFLILGIAFSMISFVMNDYFLPLGTIRFTNLYKKILASNPELELESNSVKRYQDSVMITGTVKNNVIDRITILDRDDKKNKRIIIAKKATLLESDQQYEVISLVLENVFIHTPSAKKEQEFEYSYSEKMVYNILLKDISVSMKSLTPMEMSSRDVYEAIKEKEEEFRERKIDHLSRMSEILNKTVYLYERNPKDSEVVTNYNNYKKIKNKLLKDRSLQLHKIEFNKKLALPLGCVIFLIFAFPVGLLSKRSGRSVGFGIGLLITIIYWGMLFAGQSLAIRNNFSPVLSIWMGNFLVFGSGVILFIRRSRI